MIRSVVPLCCVLACGRIGFDAAAQQPLEIATGQLVVGYRHACLRAPLDLGGELFCWGQNDFGQVGTGDREDVARPTQIAPGKRWMDVSAGEQSTCAIDDAGVTFCWGGNGNGQLGINTTEPVLTPVAISGLRFAHVYNGARHVCGVTVENVLYCWGRNSACQLGNGFCGSNADRLQPEMITIEPPQVGNDNAWVAVGPGEDHTCALQTDGRVWCMGSNSAGQLGQGDTPNPTRERPEAVVDTQAQIFAATSAGRDFSCALDRTGNLFVWGRNDNGQLGLGDRVQHPSPIPIQDVTYAMHSCGVTHACAARPDRSLWCWGSNAQGQLGLGAASNVDQLTAQQVAGEWVDVHAGENFSCALSSANEVYCWGANSDGQLGDGSGEPSPSPIQVTNRQL